MKKTLYLLLIIMALLLTACASSVPINPIPSPTPAPKKTVVVPLQTPTPLPTTPTPIQRVPFLVTRIDMSVSPSSIAGTVCGSYIVVTYTAVFHAPDNSTGGSIMFGYTVNGGRSGGGSGQVLDFAAGQTSESFSFTWAGNLPPDHTYPGLGGVLVSSPNIINSPLVKPTGVCV